MLTFYHSFSYTGTLVFTFGCGTILLIASYWARRLNKLTGIALILFGLSVIGVGITKILEKYNYIDPSSIVSLIPAFTGLASIPILSLSSLKMIEGKPRMEELRKHIKISFIAFTVCFAMLIGLFIFAYTK